MVHRSQRKSQNRVNSIEGKKEKEKKYYRNNQQAFSENGFIEEMKNDEKLKTTNSTTLKIKSTKTLAIHCQLILT